MFLTLPLPTANADPEEALRAYIEECRGYSNDDVDLAVKQFTSGLVKGVNKGFAPTTAQFSAQLRANLDYQAEQNQRRNNLRLQYQERQIDEEWQHRRTPAAKARVKGMLDQMKEKARERTPQEIAAAREMLAKLDHHFADDFIEGSSEFPVSSYLARQLEDGK